MRLKELAKFGSGVAAWESVTHASLAVSGQVPITLFGITISPTVNTIQIILPAVISAALAYYAWGSKKRA